MKQKMRKRIFVWTVVCLVAIGFFPQIVIGSESMQGEVLFKADQPDENGVFVVRMIVLNAKFNTYQFALKYDTASLVPIDSKGSPAAQFNSFATRLEKTGALAAIGTNLNTYSGLIEFAGYVMPGSMVTTRGAEGKPGYAVLGTEGYEIYQFRFKLTGSGKAGLALATESSGVPYSKSLPEGGALFDAGSSVPINIRFDMPASVGDSSSSIPGSHQTEGVAKEEIITIEHRFQNTLILRIDCNTAVENGRGIYIDSENSKVQPYVNENGRTMVPIRFIAEKLGASVDWDAENGRVTIVSKDRTVIMTVGSKQYTVDGVVYTMDTEPVIMKGWNRTLVPIRFISEELDRAVEWDPIYRLVLITKKTAPWQLDRKIELQVTDIILDNILCSDET